MRWTFCSIALFGIAVDAGGNRIKALNQLMAIELKNAVCLSLARSYLALPANYPIILVTFAAACRMLKSVLHFSIPVYPRYLFMFITLILHH